MTLYYAGIGSRKTPEHIQNIMSHCASYLGSQKVTLRSGGAIGADKAFENGADIVNSPKEIYLPWRNYNNSESPLNPNLYPFSNEEIDFTSKFHPAWHKCSPSVRLLHVRNTRILLGIENLHGEHVKPVNFIICWTHLGQLKGGTSQALRIAKTLEIPIINLGEAQSPKELENKVLEIDKILESIKSKDI